MLYCVQDIYDDGGMMEDGDDESWDDADDSFEDCKGLLDCVCVIVPATADPEDNYESPYEEEVPPASDDRSRLKSDVSLLLHCVSYYIAIYPGQY